MIKKVIFGGGCFWCTEAIFQQLEGVHEVISGYAGGHIRNPSYREVCNGITGHAEVVKISYDEQVISLSDLIKIHLTTHNPTTLNRQGADKGTQYRSIIFYKNDIEKALFESLLQEVQKYFDQPIVTELKEESEFFHAEAYHQNYYASNPEKAYCQAVINPKLSKARQFYADKMKST